MSDPVVYCNIHFVTLLRPKFNSNQVQVASIHIPIILVVSIAPIILEVPLPSILETYPIAQLYNVNASCTHLAYLAYT